MWGVNSLSNIRNRFIKKYIFLLKSSKQLTLIVISGKAQNSKHFMGSRLIVDMTSILSPFT